MIAWSSHFLFVRVISEIGDSAFAAHYVGVQFEAVTESDGEAERPKPQEVKPEAAAEAPGGEEPKVVSLDSFRPT